MPAHGSALHALVCRAAAASSPRHASNGWMIRGIHVAPRRFAVVALTMLAGTALPAFAAPVSPPPGAWEYLRTQLYGNRDIGVVDEGFMRLDVPANTPDPAATPISVHFGGTAPGHIKRVRFIIDNNPSPIVSTFDFPGTTPIDEIDLRVRVDRFTSVRAIAETTDGRTEMRSGWVNASGGCSAAPESSASGKTGEMRFRESPDAKSLQVTIRHPNASGFQIDPRSGDLIPAWYISHLQIITAAGPLVEADTGISIAENPSVRIVSTQALTAPIEVKATDTKGEKYAATWSGTGAAGLATRGN